MKTMLAYIPKEYRDDINYEIETDVYYTDTVGLPFFNYSTLYECYICRGDMYRKMNPLESIISKTSKKENKKVQ